MARILVPDYFGQTVVAGLRSLARHGDICDVAWDYRGVRRLFRSRVVRKFFQITAATDDDARYAREVREIVAANRYDVLMPFALTACYAVSRHAELLAPHVRFMVPDFRLFALANDKLKTAEACRALGVTTPQVFGDHGANDIRAISNAVAYPVVLKARSGSGVQEGMRYANSKEELLRAYDEMTALSASTGASDFSSPIVQEFIPGFIHDACTLTERGRVVAVLTQIRQMMYPIYGGIGAINVTTNEPALARLAIQILEGLNFHGPAQIEFKFDERDGKYKLIELNPKLWGTLDLSIKAGVDFPRMIRDLVLGEKVRTFPPYPAGLRYKFLFPQASIGYVQSFREVGWRALWDSRRYKQTFWDVDLADPLPDLYRLLATGHKILTGRYRTVHENLGRSRINPPHGFDSASGLDAVLDGSAGAPHMARFDSLAPPMTHDP
jgi:predicted ATP-grasp superfamily ATP-dependent carboligase